MDNIEYVYIIQAKKFALVVNKEEVFKTKNMAKLQASAYNEQEANKPWHELKYNWKVKRVPLLP